MRARLWSCLAVFALALLVRLLYLGHLHDTVVFDLPMGDGLRYDRWGRDIAGGNWLGDQVFYQAPLYPYLLGLLYAVVGHSLLAVRLVQALLGAAACGLLTSAGASFFNLRSGIVSGLLLALSPSAIFFDGIIQKSALDTFLLCALLASLGWSQHRRDWLPPLLMGLAEGLLVLTRENALLLAPVLLVLLAWQARHMWLRPITLRVGALLLGMALVLLPVAGRNAYVGGEFHLTTSQLGPNLYIGNGAGATGIYRALRWGRGDPVYEQRDATELAEQAMRRKLTSGEVSSYWLGRTITDIADDPGRWVRLMGYKTALLFNATEIVDTEDQYTYARWSWLLRGLNPLLHLGVLLPLAVFAGVLQWRQWRTAAPLYAIMAVYAASVIAFYVMARYRFPLVPMLALIAGWGVAEVSRWRRPLPWRRLIAPLGVAGVVAIGSNWPIHDRDMMRATTHYSIAVHLAERDGPSERAISHLREAVTLRPQHSGPRLALAQMLAAANREVEAVAVYRELIAQHPRHVMALRQFAILLLDARDPAARDAPLALRVAQQANALTGGRDPKIVELVERARRAADRDGSR